MSSNFAAESIDDTFERISNGDGLAELIATRWQHQTPPNAIVAISHRGRISIEASGTVEPRCTIDSRFTVPLGCVTKLLTATLLLRFLRRERLDNTVPVSAISRLVPPHLSHITCKQLLEHTHGLDDPDLVAAPLRSDGNIDIKELASLLEHRRHIAPGKIYSYSSLGAWLPASILEENYGKPYGLLLVDHLLRALPSSTSTLSAVVSANERRAICPALGRELQLSLKDLLKIFLRYTPSFQGNSGIHAENYEILPTCFPGWHPFERGVVLGWKYLGEDWFGHQSILPGARIMIRANRSRRIALAISCDTAPLHIAGALFGKSLPEFRRSATLVPSLSGATSSQLMSFTGWYSHGDKLLRIQTEDTTLRVSSFARGTTSTPQLVQETTLIQVDDRLFIASKPIRNLHYLHFVVEGERTTLAWNGQFVWRHCDVQEVSNLSLDLRNID